MELTKQIPKGYKQTEVGVIPEDWEVIHLGDEFNFKNGLNKAKEYFGYGSPIVNYMDVFRYPGIRLYHINGLVSVTNDEQKSYSANKGDVFFTRTSETLEEIGIASVLLDNINHAVFSGFILRARPIGGKFDIFYCMYCFSPMFIRKQIISKGSYTTRALTNGRSLSSVIIPLPPLPEQKAIAQVLSDTDSLIESLDALIDKKKAMKQGAMQELLTGKRRLPEFAKSDKYKQTEVGVIPEDWEVEYVADLAEKIIGGGTPSRSNNEYWNGPIPWMSVKDLNSMATTSTQETITKKGLKNSASNLIRRGTLICSTRMTVGKPVIYEIDVAINQDMKALFWSSAVHTKFSFYTFCHLENTISQISGGSTVKGLSLPDLKKISFPLPPLPEQKAIAQVLTDMDNEIEAIEKKRDKYKQIKQGMMEQLLTGKVRLI